MRVAVTGATGFVGSALTGALEAIGHEVSALTRHPERYVGAGTPVAADIHEPDSLLRALAGHDAAYYLVHSLGEVDFAERDRAGAAAFADAATANGLRQIVYLGGLGDDADDLSEHLRSRREVEAILLGAAPTTALRAGIVIGDQGISWEILRQLVDRLPMMITPRWVQTQTQPIALHDALADLIGVLGRPGTVGETYEIGGPEPLTYRDMMLTTSRVMGHRRIIVPLPLLSPRLSSHWLRFITDVDLTTARALVESLTNEVIVHDRRIDALLNHTPMSFEAAARQALAAREERLGRAAPIVRLPEPIVGTAGPPIVDTAKGLCRRRWTSGVTLVVGTMLLATTFHLPLGSSWFPVLTLLLATIWITGALVSGPIPVNGPGSAPPHTVVAAAAVGTLTFGAFVAAHALGQRLPVVSTALDRVLDTADASPVVVVLSITLLNAVAEELFFRGAVVAAVEPWRPALTSTIVYVAATAATANLALVVAAAAMGTVLSVERSSTRGVLAPIVTHLTWSTLMLLALPR